MEPKFLVDTMCGRLSRWLRILGYDANWIGEQERKTLIVRCLKESRILLTRDHRYEKTRGIRKIILSSEIIRDQIRQIFSELHLKLNEENFFRLCTFCNVYLEPVEKQTVFSRVPPFVYKTCHCFYQCGQCKRTYWEGTHKKLFADQMENILKDLPLPPN